MVLHVVLIHGLGSNFLGLILGAMGTAGFTLYRIYRESRRRASDGLERTLLQATPPSADALGILFSVIGAEDQVPADAMIFPWNDLVEFSAVDPWPNVRIATTTDRAILSPARTRDANEFARALDDVFRTAKVRGAKRLIMDKGWRRFDAVEPDVVATFPDSSAASGYRESGKAETIVATREPPPTEQSDQKPLPPYSDRHAIVASHAVLTNLALYIATANARIVRLPLDKLRASKYVEGDETVFTFGRNTFVRISEPTRCPLANALLARLKKK